MSGNQTIANLPYDVSDSNSLKRFLRELVDNLDVTLGYKGDNKAVTSKDLSTAGGIGGVLTTTKENTNDIAAGDKSIKELQDQVEEFQADIEQLQYLLKAKQLGSEDYVDFNAQAWSLLIGRGQFTANGDDMLNAPITPGVGVTYKVYVDSTKTQGAVWQQVIFEDGANISVWLRLALAGTWLQIA